MDRLENSSYDVKRSLQSVVRREAQGQTRLTPIIAPEAASRRVGDDAPELICMCDDIPFPHFISQCTQLRAREARDAIAHTPGANETPVL